jgi:hypothetical protein
MHEGGFTLSRHSDGTVAFFYPTGLPLHLAPPPPRWVGHAPLAPTTERLASHGITIGAGNLPTWDGTPFNPVHAIDVLYVLPAHTAPARPREAQ